MPSRADRTVRRPKTLQSWTRQEICSAPRHTAAMAPALSTNWRRTGRRPSAQFRGRAERWRLPYGGVTMDGRGNLYGTTNDGGWRAALGRYHRRARPDETQRHLRRGGEPGDLDGQERLAPHHDRPLGAGEA